MGAGRADRPRGSGRPREHRVRRAEMADKSAISWTDATWNCIRGCTRKDEDCENCYAEILAATRLAGPGGPYEGLAVTTKAGRAHGRGGPAATDPGCARVRSRRSSGAPHLAGDQRGQQQGAPALRGPGPRAGRRAHALPGAAAWPGGSGAHREHSGWPDARVG